jgi:hypothetical protein
MAGSIKLATTAGLSAFIVDQRSQRAWRLRTLAAIAASVTMSAVEGYWRSRPIRRGRVTMRPKTGRRWSLLL